MVVDRNSTSFWVQLRELFESKQYDPTNVLKYSQFMVIEYVKATRAGQVVNGGRGLICNHGMGTGKTILAAGIADALQREGMDVVVIGPKSLKENFAANVEKLRKLSGDPSILAGGWGYFTLRASNLAEQVVRAEVASAPLVGESDDLDAVSLTSAFEGKVVLIDEAHLFCNSVAHGRDVALKIYRALMAAKLCWVFLFTGTLVTNRPFESVPAYNLVAGRMVFPEDEQEFNRWFGSEELLALNRGKLQNLMSGYLSWAVAGDDDGSWPKRLATKIVRLEMEGEQLAAYDEARLVEGREDAANARRKKTKAGIFAKGFASESSSSSYRVRSRIAGNGSNKVRAVCDLVASTPAGNVLVQNTFVEKGGIKDVAEGLRSCLSYEEFVIGTDGIVAVGPPELVGVVFKAQSDVGLTWQNVGEAPTYTQRWYVLLSGATDKRVFEWVLQVLRDPRNRYGAFIHVVLCSSVGNLGLDLKNGRVVVCMSLGFHIEDYNQLVSRYERYLASVLLPPDMRTIQPYILLSSRRDEEGGRGPQSTDEHLLSICMEKMKLNAKHAEVRWSVSIECAMGVSTIPELCRRCMPTGMPLTIGKFRDDMWLPNNCVELKSEMEDMKILEVNVGGETRHVGRLEGPLRFYEISGDKKYRLISQSHELYSLLVKFVAEA